MYTASSFSTAPQASWSGPSSPSSALSGSSDVAPGASIDISAASLPGAQPQGVSAYARMGTQGAAMVATPHQLISLLFDGIKTALLMARHHMAQGDTVAKGNAISKAINIIDNGLKASLDEKAGGAEGAVLAGQLSSLYDYVVQRLMLANHRNDPALIDQADRLLDNVGSAWREVGARAGSTT